MANFYIFVDRWIFLNRSEITVLFSVAGTGGNHYNPADFDEGAENPCNDYGGDRIG